jgi:hypothetical protein
LKLITSVVAFTVVALSVAMVILPGRGVVSGSVW